MSEQGSFQRDDQRLARQRHGVPDPAERRDQLHAQRGQGDRRRVRRHGHPLRVGRATRSCAPGGCLPGTVQPKSEIPDAVLEHLRYPEDMFKVQRYQLGAYHVLDAGDFYEANDRWAVPTDPNNPDQPAAPYRLSVPPRGHRHVLADLGLHAGEPREPCGLRVRRRGRGRGHLRDDPGETSRARPARSPDQGRSPTRSSPTRPVTQALLPYNRETNTRVVNGNLLTLPVGGGLLYVQPLYSLRTSGEGNFPVLRFIAVSFGQEVGVGRTLGEAIYDVLNLPGTPSDSPTGRPRDPATRSPRSRARNPPGPRPGTRREPAQPRRREVRCGRHGVGTGRPRRLSGRRGRGPRPRPEGDRHSCRRPACRRSGRARRGAMTAVTPWVLSRPPSHDSRWPCCVVDRRPGRGGTWSPCRSDGGYEFVECGGQPEQRRGVDRELVIGHDAGSERTRAPGITTLAVR